MPIGGMVVTLDPDPTRRGAALRALAADGRLTVGVACGDRLPVVAETSTLDESEQLFEHLSAQRDVVFVDVVSVDFSDLEGGPHNGQA